MAGDGKCPFCEATIDPGDFPWTCQVCGFGNDHHSFLLNCENCHFAPRVIRCPTCDRPFELFLLVGTFQGAPKEVVQADEILGASAGHTFFAQDLMTDLTESLVRVFGIARAWNEGVFQALCGVSFRFPKNIACLIWHSAFQSPDGRCWLHGWLFEQPNPKVGDDEPLAQISAWYPADEGGEYEENRAGFRLTDIMIRHD